MEGSHRSTCGPATSAAPASPPAETQKNKTKKASWWRMKSEDVLEKDSAGPKPPVSAVPDKEAVAHETFLPPSATDLSTDKCEVKDVGVQTEVSCSPNSLLFFCTKKVTFNDEPLCPEVPERDEPGSRPSTPAGHGGSQGATLDTEYGYRSTSLTSCTNIISQWELDCLRYKSCKHAEYGASVQTNIRLKSVI